MKAFSDVEREQADKNWDEIEANQSKYHLLGSFYLRAFISVQL